MAVGHRAAGTEPGLAVGFGQQRPSRHPRARRWLRNLSILAGAIIATAGIALAGLWVLTPSVSNAQQLASDMAESHHSAYPGPPVPYRFAAALKATEDHRFGSEPGVDPISVVRVAKNWVTGGPDGGGATIYQQLAKMLYTNGRSDSFATEVKQVGLAIKLSATYSASQILQMYADVAYYGNNDYGLAAASCGYFGITPEKLSWPKAALLAGLVQGPSIDDPIRHPDRARTREEHVIGRLVAIGTLTQAQANHYLTWPISSLVAKAGHGRHCTA
jgi:membrane peptidoglycan carboxypeptidase